MLMRVHPRACSRFLSNRCVLPPTPPLPPPTLLYPRAHLLLQPAELRLPPPERQQWNDPLCFTAEHWRAASFRQEAPRVSLSRMFSDRLMVFKHRSSISVNTYRWQLTMASHWEGRRGRVCLQVQWVSWQNSTRMRTNWMNLKCMRWLGGWGVGVVNKPKSWFVNLLAGGGKIKHCKYETKQISSIDLVWRVAWQNTWGRCGAPCCHCLLTRTRRKTKGRQREHEHKEHKAEYEKVSWWYNNSWLSASVLLIPFYHHCKQLFCWYWSCEALCSLQWSQKLKEITEGWHHAGVIRPISRSTVLQSEWICIQRPEKVKYICDGTVWLPLICLVPWRSCESDWIT